MSYKNEQGLGKLKEVFEQSVELMAVYTKIEMQRCNELGVDEPPCYGFFRNLLNKEKDTPQTFDEYWDDRFKFYAFGGKTLNLHRLYYFTEDKKRRER